MNRRVVHCCGLLLMPGMMAVAATDPSPLNLMAWGELHLKTESPIERQERPDGTLPVAPVPAPTAPDSATVIPAAIEPRKLPAKREPLQLKLDEFYFQTEAQYERESQRAGTLSATLVRQRTLLDPTLGLGVSGSLYHPNLVQFRLAPELGLDWKTTSEDPGASSNSGRLLQRYHGSIDFLAQKPYAVSLFGDKEMTYREYDFFSRVRVDSETYGARAGYMAGPVPFTVSAQHYDESQEDPTRPQNYSQDTLWVNAQNQRSRYEGRTRLNYNVARFKRQDDGFSHLEGLTQSLNLFDTENFGGALDPRLTSLLNYNSVSQTAQPTDKLLVQESLRLRHSPKLESFYEYAFDTSSAGDSEATTQDGRAGVNYQHTPNLALGSDIHGSLTRSTSPDSSLETKNYGVGANAQYSRQPAPWVTFTCGDDGRWDRQDQSASGVTTTIFGEKHTLSDSTLTFLNLPLVNQPDIQVWNTSRTIRYTNTLDYITTRVGALTQIQRVTGGQINNGDLVLVDYSAAQQNSGIFDTLANTASFRVDFWEGLLGLYGRWARQNYSGGETLLLRWFDDKTAGVDTVWRWFRAGAEYEVVQANIAPYQRQRLYQSAQFRPVTGADLSLNADESWTDYQDNHLRQTSYGFIMRWQQQVTVHLSATVEGGVRFDRGTTFDQDNATARAGLDWAIGKLTLKLIYELNDVSQQANQQNRQYVFLRVRRDF